MDTWIGLAHVRPGSSGDLLSGALGAFVPVVALALSQQDFVSQVVSTLRTYGFAVLEIDDIEIWEERASHFAVDEKIQELARSLTVENPVLFGSFHTYGAE